MTPSKLNLTVYRGRDFTKDLQFKDSAGELLDISLWDFKSEVRATNCQSGDLLATFHITVDTSTSTIVLSLDETETLNIPEGIAYWDLLVTIGDVQETYVTGKVKALCTITRV